MSEQQRASAPAEQHTEEIVDPAPAAPSGGAAGAQGTTAGVDDLLDEIDGVLEANAEEFVRGFVQKGGQ